MKVVICGAGEVGYGIAERLVAERNDVTVIDTNPNLIRTVRDTLDAKGYVGHGAHPDILARAGLQDADMLIAVTSSDEVNMIACQVGHSIFTVPTKIARIRSQAYFSAESQELFSSDCLPIDVIISPEIEVAEMVVRRIALTGVTDAVNFSNGEIVMVAIECLEDCPVINTPLTQLSDLFPDLLSTVVAVSRNGRLFIPHSHDQLAVGDLAYVISHRDHVRRTLGLFGHEEKTIKRIVIAGGGTVALYVAKALEKRQDNIRVRIIEKSHERAVQIAEELRKTVVLEGSALDEKLLSQAEVSESDLLIALTNDDQINILASVKAKLLGCGGNLTLINNQSYQDFTRTLGIDAQVNPGSVTLSKVLQHVRRGRIRAVHSVHKGAAELIEAEAFDTSPLVGVPLRDLDLPVGIRIGAVYRDGKVVRPSGDMVIKPKDRVVIFAMADAVRHVEQMFRVSLEFF